jgi:HPt (histidine-containing phosphotransfer) domain-containing protein
MHPTPTVPVAIHDTDPEALERLRRFGGSRLVVDMITLFLEAVPQRLAAARRGLAGGNAGIVEHELHALKSSSAQLGAVRMNRLSMEGEQLARAGTLDETGAILDALDAEHLRVERWLAAERSQGEEEA